MDGRLVEPGEYTGIIKNVVAGTSGEKETPCVAVEFLVEELDINRTVYIYMTEATAKYSVRKLEALGFNGDFENPECAAVAIKLRMRFEEYDGEERERWDLASWGGGAGLAEGGKKTVKAMNALWKKHDGQAQTKEKEKEVDKDDDREEPAPRERAWDSFLTYSASPAAKNDRKLATEEWAAVMKEVHGDKEPASYTDADWVKIAEHCELF